MSKTLTCEHSEDRARERGSLVRNIDLGDGRPARTSSAPLRRVNH